NISDAEELPYVNFDTENSRISAYAGCNRLSAGITGREKNALTFSDVLSTRMACPDMTAEQNVSTALEQVRNFGISLNGNLLLFSAGGNVVMELMRINE
ncbi:MAG: META domain-containing protein, partial [Muribaculaceae bacterium]|nr:META domain-containing protein [Muribaculaceae bacterium]